MADDKPKSVSRREFLKKTGQGAAVVGLAAAAPTLLKGAGALLMGDASASTTPSGDPSLPLVAYVRDPYRGEVVVMAGANEVVRVNPGLARLLYAVAASG